MFMLIESVRSAGEAIVGHAMRSILTAFGIAIGVASIVAVITVMEGAENTLNAEVGGLGGNGLTIQAVAADSNPLLYQTPTLAQEDMALVASIDGIASVTPGLISATRPLVELSYGTATALARVIGTTHSHQDFDTAALAHGRFLSVADDQRRRRVCVLSAPTAKSLGFGDEPIGKHVTLAGEWFRVIGVLEASDSLLSALGQPAYVPYNTMQTLFGAEDSQLNLMATVAEGTDVEAMRGRLESVLRRAHNIGPDDEDDFAIETDATIAELTGQVAGIVTAVAVAIVSISLLVGGVGIMNIMLVSVTERTREIGILKALGATRRQILLQFLTEAIALCLLGAVAGLLLGHLIAVVFGAFAPKVEVHVSLVATLAAVGFSTLVGIVFGILPAYRAADLRPIDALRYE